MINSFSCPVFDTSSHNSTTALWFITVKACRTKITKMPREGWSHIFSVEQNMMIFAPFFSSKICSKGRCLSIDGTISTYCVMDCWQQVHRCFQYLSGYDLLINHQIFCNLFWPNGNVHQSLSAMRNLVHNLPCFWLKTNGKHAFSFIISRISSSRPGATTTICDLRSSSLSWEPFGAPPYRRFLEDKASQHGDHRPQMGHQGVTL